MRRNSSASKRSMIVMSMPASALASAYTFGAVWYIGAGITVLSPSPSWKSSASSARVSSRFSSVDCSRTTPFGLPVVPEV